MGGHDVASTVSNIIAAFYSLRDTVAKVKHSRLNKAAEIKSKSKSSSGKSASAKGIYSSRRLDVSTTTAPTAIHHEYAAGLKSHGDRFQKGDNLALARLAATLVKLNAGLVDIIGSFLDQKPREDGIPKPSARGKSSTRTRDLNVDYTRLAILAEASCFETCQELTQLRRRLAKSAENVNPQGHKVMNANNNSKASRSPKDKASVRRSSKPLQYAFVRTRPRIEQRGSTDSTSTSTTATANSLSKSQAPNGVVESAKRRKKGRSHGKATNRAVDIVASPALSGTTAMDLPVMIPWQFEGSRWPQAAQSSTLVPESGVHHHTQPPSLQRQHTRDELKNTLKSRPDVGFALTGCTAPKRDPSVAGRSYRTTKTGVSTQIGEIPFHNWAADHSLDQMSALNVAPCWGPYDGTAQYAQLKEQHQKPPRRGFFAKVFRRVPVAAAGG